MVFLRMILEFIVSKDYKLQDPKKIQAIIQMLIPTNPQQIQVFNSIMLYQEFCIYNGPNYQTHEEDKKLLWTLKCQVAWELLK
jgi:hypothetical protein